MGKIAAYARGGLIFGDTAYWLVGRRLGRPENARVAIDFFPAHNRCSDGGGAIGALDSMDLVKSAAIFSALLWLIGAVALFTGRDSLAEILINIFGTLTIVLGAILVVSRIRSKRRKS
jgi:hypothetical protein